MSYTAGPWRVGKHGTVVADAPVPGVNGSDAVDFYGGHLIAESITPSNAKLIAAAPDLLQVAKDYAETLAEQQLFCECGQPDCRTTRLRAAIIKATV